MRPSTPPIPATRTTRSSSRTSQARSVSEKFSIFKDEEIEHKPGGAIPLINKELAQRITAIAARRARLLQQLQELQEEEDLVLAQFGHTATDGAEVPSLRRPEALAKSGPPPPLHAPLLPRPLFSPSRLPLIQPSESTRTRVHTRTVSAPPVPTPLAPRYRRPSTSKRRPLGDKTIDTPARFPSEVLNLYDPSRISALDKSPRPTTGDNPMNSLWSAADPQQSRILRLPTNFGDDFEQLNLSNATSRRMPGTPRHNVTPRPRSRDDSKSRRRSRGRKPVTPAATPSESRSYEVPRTVARKKWEF